MVNVGAEVFQLVTLGMYNNPLAIYREYIQNAADSFSLAGLAGGTVRITINRPQSTITILDNGPGLSREQAVRALLPLAQSEKPRNRSRGFRGIGRLSGLAFADDVTFLTRCRPEEPITRVRWDGEKINRLRYDSALSWETIRACVQVDTITDVERPSHFFEAQIRGIGRHAAGIVLNEKLVRNYVGEVCPVPMTQDFAYAGEISGLFPRRRQPLTLRVEFEGDPDPITRPHLNTIRFSDERSDTFTEFERVRIPALNGSRDAAVGWVLHSSYQGAIPRGLGIRGIRARIGNIQVGDETTFDHLFSEERFNRWCVGEIHVQDTEMIPNARRDYFEPGPRLRNFENHVAAICGEVANRCRRASKARNAKRKLQTLLRDAEDACKLVNSGYLSAKDARGLLADSIERVRQARDSVSKMDRSTEWEQTLLDEVETQLAGCSSEHNGTADMDAEDAVIYQKVFGALARVADSPAAARKTIEAVLTDVGHDER